jgi:hypothetical protein
MAIDVLRWPFAARCGPPSKAMEFVLAQRAEMIIIRRMENRSTAEEATALLRQLFPGGLASREMVEALCPEGWEQSPLRGAFHPSPEALYGELLHLRENLRSVFGQGPRRELPEDGRPPTFEEFEDGLDPTEPVSAAEEIGRLTGLCLWDIFSDNHEVLLPDGRAAHLGSFRGSAGEIAGFFYERNGPENDGAADFMNINMDYMEFYMGTRLIAHRASLRPVYGLIFSRLGAAGCDWRYSFPRLSLVRLDEAKAKAGAKPEWESYNPSAAFAAEEERQSEEEALADAENSLERAWRDSIEAARHRPPPETVLAYHDIYGRWPAGWPPWEEVEP